MKDWQNKACKGEIKLNIISVYINNVGYISGKAYLCTAIKDGSVAQLDRATPF